jgi:hypothetical protein
LAFSAGRHSELPCFPPLPVPLLDQIAVNVWACSLTSVGASSVVGVETEFSGQRVPKSAVFGTSERRSSSDDRKRPTRYCPPTKTPPESKTSKGRKLSRGLV